MVTKILARATRRIPKIFYVAKHQLGFNIPLEREQLKNAVAHVLEVLV